MSRQAFTHPNVKLQNNLKILTTQPSSSLKAYGLASIEGIKSPIYRAAHMDLPIQDFREKILSKYEGHIPVKVVFQSVDKLPEGYVCPADRTKPRAATMQCSLVKASSTNLLPSSDEKASIPKKCSDTPSRTYTQNPTDCTRPRRGSPSLRCDSRSASMKIATSRQFRMIDARLLDREPEMTTMSGC